jgi:transcriptional regulator with XRE-family HTH domain
MKSIYSPLSQAFAKVIREAREKAGMTQRAVADRLGWPQSRVSLIERSGRFLGAAELEELAWAMRESADELYRAAQQIAGPALLKQPHRVRWSRQNPHSPQEASNPSEPYRYIGNGCSLSSMPMTCVETSSGFLVFSHVELAQFDDDDGVWGPSLNPLASNIRVEGNAPG